MRRTIGRGILGTMLAISLTPSPNLNAQVLESLGKVFDVFDGVAVLGGPLGVLGRKKYGDKLKPRVMSMISLELLTEGIGLADPGNACWGTREGQARYAKLTDSLTRLVRDSALAARVDTALVRMEATRLYPILSESLRVEIGDSLLRVTGDNAKAAASADSLSKRLAVTLARRRAYQVVRRVVEDETSKLTGSPSVKERVRDRLERLDRDYDLAFLGIRDCWTLQLAFGYDYGGGFKFREPVGLNVKGALRVLPSFAVHLSSPGPIYFGPNIGLAQLHNLVWDTSPAQFQGSGETLQLGGLLGYFNDATGMRFELACYWRLMPSIKWSGPQGIPVPDDRPGWINLSSCGLRAGLELGTVRKR